METETVAQLATTSGRSLADWMSLGVAALAMLAAALSALAAVTANKKAQLFGTTSYFKDRLNIYSSDEMYQALWHIRFLRDAFNAESLEAYVGDPDTLAKFLEHCQARAGQQGTPSRDWIDFEKARHRIHHFYKDTWQLFEQGCLTGDQQDFLLR
jgi:hypothetical protein